VLLASRLSSLSPAVLEQLSSFYAQHHRYASPVQGHKST
jgi:hypothetical protein